MRLGEHGTRDTGVPVLFMSSRVEAAAKEYLRSEAVPGHTVMSTHTARVTIQDSRSAGLFGPCCFVRSRGRREGRPKNFDSLRNLPSLSVYAPAALSLISSSPRRFLLGEATAWSLDHRFGLLPPAACGRAGRSLPQPCINPLHGTIRNCPFAQLVLFQPRPHRGPCS